MPPPGLPTRSPPRNGLPAWAWLLISGMLALVLAVGSLVVWGWSIFVGQARTALAEHPAVIEHIGRIDGISADFVAMGAIDDDDTFVFRLRGSRGNGTAVARFVSTDADQERIAGGTLRLPDGSSVPLDPPPAADDDELD